MTDIKPKDGEIWMVRQAGYKDGSPWPIIWRFGNCSIEPLYRLSRHHPINDVIEAHRNGAKVSREEDIFEGLFAQLTLDESLAKYKVEPEPRDLEIPWDVINPKYVRAEKQGVGVRLSTADNKHQTITADLLSIDLTGVPNGATAERPE